MALRFLLAIFCSLGVNELAAAQGNFYPGGTPGPDTIGPVGPPPAGFPGWEVWDSGGFLPADGKPDKIDTAGNKGKDLIRAGLEDTIHADPDDVCVIYIPGFYIFPVFAGRFDAYLEFRGFLLRAWWKIRAYLLQGSTLLQSLTASIDDHEAVASLLQESGDAEVAVADYFDADSFVMPEDWSPLDSAMVALIDASAAAGTTLDLADETMPASEMRTHVQGIAQMLAVLEAALGSGDDSSEESDS